MIIVDPRERTIRLVDRESDRVPREPAALRHPALPGFSPDLNTRFGAIVHRCAVDPFGLRAPNR